MYSQKEIFDYLKANPLGVKVWIGDLDDMNGKDYIFFDYLSEDLIGYDNKGTYRTAMQFTVATKQFDDRKTLVDYIKKEFNVSITYEFSNEFEYYLARCQTSQVICEQISET